MKSIIAAALLIWPAQAATAETAFDKCEVIGGIAEAVMEGRQMGMSPSQLLGRVPEESRQPFLMSMMKVAYERERMATDEDRLTAVQEFRSYIEGICLFRD